jgi:DNA (cytosine-5)-methyltransferase 1
MSFTFVDLFSGIGGFHAALEAEGGQCVLAAEIDEAARAIYQANWNMDVAGDIVPLTEGRVQVPPHDVLCAGFPCQPFSKSGKQLGMDEARGTLFWNIARVIEVRSPSLVILENVRNLVGPRHRHEWQVIIKTLRELGYAVSSDPVIASPHWFHPADGGAPQSRERVFIIGWKVGVETAHRLSGIDPLLPAGPDKGWHPMSWDLESHLPLQEDTEIIDIERYRLTEDENRWIDIWDDFLSVIDGAHLPGFPLWADDFKAIPSIPNGTPKWKREFLQKNSRFYLLHQEKIDRWKARNENLRGIPASRRKFEWQAQDSPRELRTCVLHFRPSGIRVKRPTYVPALVAMTQTSIVASRNRRLTPREAARLQGFPDTFDFGTQRDTKSYRQLGNAVSVGVVNRLLRHAMAADPLELRSDRQLVMSL